MCALVLTPAYAAGSERDCFLRNWSAVHREVPVPRVEEEERYLITSLDYSGFYRCVCRYGSVPSVTPGGIAFLCAHCRNCCASVPALLSAQRPSSTLFHSDSPLGNSQGCLMSSSPLSRVTLNPKPYSNLSSRAARDLKSAF